jgi:mannan endo-1,4-beta-mannosidase
MKSRLVVFTALLVALTAVGFAVARVVDYAPSSPPAARASLPHQPASYLGVFESGAPPDYQPVASFAKMAGRTPNLVGYYSGWAQPFATAFARKALDHGVIPFVQIDPTYASVKGIADGDYDHYLSAYAASVRNYGHPVVIGFGHEMNAPWYAWGYKHVSPATFIAAWRHIVRLFGHFGALNVTWLWTINSDRDGTGPVQNWWPGDKYVTWVGIDGYYYRPSDTFASVFGTTIVQVRAFTSKPVLLSETAVGPAAGQFVKIGNLFAGMRRYQALGLVWFDKDQHGSIYRQNWRIEGNAPAEAAFRLGLSSLVLHHA